jgi:hypothetical protein
MSQRPGCEVCTRRGGGACGDEHKRGAFMRIEMNWQDTARTLGLSLTPGSRMIGSPSRVIDVRVAGDARTQPVRFDGAAIVKL